MSNGGAGAISALPLGTPTMASTLLTINLSLGGHFLVAFLR